MSQTIYALAKSGQIEDLLTYFSNPEASEDDDDDRDLVALYQWLLVSATFGHIEAGDTAEDLLEATLSRAGDETVAYAHFEVGRWFLLGEQNVEVNEAKAFVQLQLAADLKVQRLIDLENDLAEIAQRLSPEIQQRFNSIFVANEP